MLHFEGDEFIQFQKCRILVHDLDQELAIITEHLDVVQRIIDTFFEQKDEFIQHEIMKRKDDNDEFYGNIENWRDHIDDDSEWWAHDVFNTKYKKKYPQILYGGFVLSVFSVIERNLLNICEILKLTLTIGPKGCENIGRGIYRAKDLLRKSGNYDINPKHWKELVQISRLRNHIIHNGYQYTLHNSEEIDTDFLRFSFSLQSSAINDDLLCYLEDHGITTDFGEIVPHINYLSDLIKFARDFLLKICIDVKIYYPGHS